MSLKMIEMWRKLSKIIFHYVRKVWFFDLIALDALTEETLRDMTLIVNFKII